MWKTIVTWVAKALGAAAVQAVADKLAGGTKPAE